MWFDLLPIRNMEILLIGHLDEGDMGVMIFMF